MKLFGGVDTAALKQHFGKKIMELEDEKRAVQVENNSTNFYSFSLRVRE
jgi:kinesin family protein 4/21/27